jgi:hypothetical protein
MRQQKMSEPESIRLCRIRHGGTLVSLWVETRADGGFRLIGQDISERLKEEYGDSDYEYWVDVAPGDLPRLMKALAAALRERGASLEGDGLSAQALVAKLYTDDIEAFEKFRALCAAAGIETKFGSWN